jgi:hypothetical protein
MMRLFSLVALGIAFLVIPLEAQDLQGDRRVHPPRPDRVVSAGNDMALRVVVCHHGEENARETARRMEYPNSDDSRNRT